MLSTYAQTVADHLKAEVPGLRTAEPYAGQFEADGPGRVTFQAPALFVAMFGGELSDPGTEEVVCEVRATAFVVAVLGRTEQERDSSAVALAEAVALKVRASNLGVTPSSGAKLDEAVRLHSKDLESKGFGIWAVRWTQKVRFGTSVWTGGATPTEVYLGQEPNVGEGHEADYDRVVPDDE